MIIRCQKVFFYVLNKSNEVSSCCCFWAQSGERRKNRSSQLVLRVLPLDMSCQGECSLVSGRVVHNYVTRGEEKPWLRHETLRMRSRHAFLLAEPFDWSLIFELSIHSARTNGAHWRTEEKAILPRIPTSSYFSSCLPLAVRTCPTYRHFNSRSRDFLWKRDSLVATFHIRHKVVWKKSVDVLQADNPLYVAVPWHPNPCHCGIPSAFLPHFQRIIERYFNCTQHQTTMTSASGTATTRSIVSRLVRLLSTVHAAKKDRAVSDVAWSTAFSRRHFPKTLATAIALSFGFGFYGMQRWQQNRQLEWENRQEELEVQL